VLDDFVSDETKSACALGAILVVVGHGAEIEDG
jgi:hypothetical protein